VLTGAEPVELARPRHAPAPPRRKRGSAAAAPSALAAGSVEERRFERLRALRKEIAAEQGVPPYVVFHDTTLRAMAALAPATESELSGIPGVGARKLERYGARFLAALAAAPP
jgi:ATP-dependent DNA helicase RecQ